MSALQNPANRESDSRSVVVIGSVSLATALVHVVFCALCVRFAGAPGEPSPQLPRHDAHAGAHDSSSCTQSLIESVDRDIMHARNDTLFSWRATRKRWPPGAGVAARKPANCAAAAQRPRASSYMRCSKAVHESSPASPGGTVPALTPRRVSPCLAESDGRGPAGRGGSEWRPPLASLTRRVIIIVGPAKARFRS